MEGKLITIEGISGMGKTYYFNKLKEDFKDNEDIVFQNEITDGNHNGYGNSIFKILYSTRSRFFDIGNSKAETLLIAAKQAFDDKDYVEPLLQEGKIIISDRGFDSVCVIESVMLKKELNNSSYVNSIMLNEVLSFFNRVPDKTILLVGDTEKAITRAEVRDMTKDLECGREPVKYTDEEKDILRECAVLYNMYSDLYSDRIVSINRDSDENVYERIKGIIENELEKRKEKRKNYENNTSNRKLG